MGGAIEIYQRYNLAHLRGLTKGTNKCFATVLHHIESLTGFFQPNFYPFSLQ
jgi:hypothetical protein